MQVTVVSTGVAGWFPDHQYRVDLSCGHVQYSPYNPPIVLGSERTCDLRHPYSWQRLPKVFQVTWTHPDLTREINILYVRQSYADAYRIYSDDTDYVGRISTDMLAAYYSEFFPSDPA